MSENKLEKIIKGELTLNSRKKILEFQNTLIENADEVNIVTHQDSKLFPLKHTFADGIYVRQMSMDIGTVVVGAIHKHLHVWFLLSGHISVATEESVEDYIAPCYVVAKPGTKRVIYANEDSIFVNIHKNPTNSQDIEWLEKEIVAKTREEYEEYINKNK
jgi:quercetin dioxygenase-like cupin family protein